MKIVALECFLGIRGILFRGTAHLCPVCATPVRRFMMGGGSFKGRDRGYCPRCNAKARHRRVWLHCQNETSWFSEPTALLHVAPKYCVSRRLRRIDTIAYHAVDVLPGPHVTDVASITDLPYEAETFTGILCVHVLEHVDDDVSAMAEMFRVLKPGGTAVVNVPTNMDEPTYEDATIVTAGARRAAFGEADHRRVYGHDLTRRLEGAGFVVEVHRADELDASVIDRHGLTIDEHVFHCTKPGVPA